MRILAKCLVLAVASFSAFDCSTLTELHVSDSGGDPPLSVCDLISRSEALRNQMVRVRGRVASGYEGFVLFDDSCPTDNRAAGVVWLENALSGDVSRAYADVPSRDILRAIGDQSLESFAARLPWYQPIPVAFREDESWHRLERILRSGTATVTVVGRLDYVEQSLVRQSNGGFSFAGGFGHLSGYSRQIVIARVENPRLGSRR